MKRWTPKRKFELVALWIKGDTGMVSALLRANGITIQEFREWLSRYDLLGFKGLSARNVPRGS
jgi:hypothetical protein